MSHGGEDAWDIVVGIIEPAEILGGEFADGGLSLFLVSHGGGADPFGLVQFKWKLPLPSEFDQYFLDHLIFSLISFKSFSNLVNLFVKSRLFELNVEMELSEVSFEWAVCSCVADFPFLQLLLEVGPNVPRQVHFQRSQSTLQSFFKIINVWESLLELVGQLLLPGVGEFLSSLDAFEVESAPHSLDLLSLDVNCETFSPLLEMVRLLGELDEPSQGEWSSSHFNLFCFVFK